MAEMTTLYGRRLLGGRPVKTAVPLVPVKCIRKIIDWQSRIVSIDDSIEENQKMQTNRSTHGYTQQKRIAILLLTVLARSWWDPTSGRC